MAFFIIEPIMLSFAKHSDDLIHLDLINSF